MNLQNSLAKEGLDIDEMALIAAKVVHWTKRQTSAVSKRPLAYINCLLDELYEPGEKSVDDLAGKLVQLLPSVDIDDLLGSVATYLDTKSLTN